MSFLRCPFCREKTSPKLHIYESDERVVRMQGDLNGSTVTRLVTDFVMLPTSINVF